MKEAHNNIYIGLDPSLAGFGIAIIDKVEGTVILDELSGDDHHNFILMCWSIANMYNEFIEKYKSYISPGYTKIAQELPISAGINSGKLNALGIHFYTNLGSILKYEDIRVYHPIKLKVFHHKKKYDKKDTLEVIEDILEIMKLNGFKVMLMKSRLKKGEALTSNEADAMMYAIKTYIDNNPHSVLTVDILDKYPNFNKIISLNEEKNIS